MKIKNSKNSIFFPRHVQLRSHIIEIFVVYYSNHICDTKNINVEVCVLYESVLECVLVIQKQDQVF